MNEVEFTPDPLWLKILNILRQRPGISYCDLAAAIPVANGAEISMTLRLLEIDGYIRSQITLT